MKQRRNKKERKKEDGEMGSFLKHQNHENVVYLYNTMLLVLCISKEDLQFFKPLQAFYDGFQCAL